MSDFWKEQVYLNPHDFKYCPKCGNELKIKNENHIPRLICGACGYIFYQNPIPAVGAVLLRDNKILLVKRKYEPKAGDWCLPAGFLEYGESILDGLVREVKEETNLDINPGRLFQVCNAMDDPRTHVVLVVYRGEIVNGTLKPSDDALEAEFFPFDALPEKIAFTCHVRAIEAAKKEVN